MQRIARLLAFASLSTFVSLALAQTPQPAAPSSVKPPAASTPAKPTAVPSADLLDINSATKEQLETLTGVGAVRADAIVEGRPYKGKDELYQKNIIPKSVYEKIKDKIIAKQK